MSLLQPNIVPPFTEWQLGYVQIWANEVGGKLVISEDKRNCRVMNGSQVIFEWVAGSEPRILIANELMSFSEFSEWLNRFAQLIADVLSETDFFADLGSLAFFLKGFQNGDGDSE